jgi:hypothetical protein
MKNLLLITAFAMLSGLPSLAATKPLCEVKVSYYLKSGVIEEAKIRTHAKNRQECRKKAQTLRVHAAPAGALRKKIATNWKPRSS